jgi:tRNA threonylcarbamoyladenosine biosynthesis protein TsaE
MFRRIKTEAQVSRQESIVSRSPEQTRSIGESIAKKLAGGELVLLRGPLGAGKSVLARGVAAGLGSRSWRGSPTFNLVHEYPTVPPLYHADLFRLSGGDVEGLGLEEYARPDSVLMVEWADRAPEYLRSIALDRVLAVDMSHGGGDERLVVLSVEA